MNTTSLICVAFTVLVVQHTLANESVGDLAQRLQATMLGTEKADRQIAQEIAEATAEQRKILLSAVLQIVEGAIKAPEPKSDTRNALIVGFAEVLKAVSDDDITLAAFGSNLALVGLQPEPAVIDALSACRDSKAVEALADLARLRLKQAKDMVPRFGSLTDVEKRTVDDELISLLFALKGLAKSANQSGKIAARELRAELLKLFNGSPYREVALKGLARNLDPLLQIESQPPVPRDRAPGATSPSSSKNNRESKSGTSLPLPQSSRVQGAPKIGMAVAAVIGSLIILGFFIWFLRKK